jgi:16S rRNA (guanine527-N7)-methyltransferase
LTPDTRARLDAFAAVLVRWNATINLVSRRDLPALWPRHIEDSLQLADLLPEGVERGIDLGSGAGFPGLVLAIATGIRMDLIEEDRRKCAFLREAARITAAPVTVHAARIETAPVPPAPLLTARALAPLTTLLGYAGRLLAPDGTCLFLKGREADAELAAATADWSLHAERIPSRTDASGVVLRLTAIMRR